MHVKAYSGANLIKQIVIFYDIMQYGYYKYFTFL